jgi:hypothetical protein
MAARDDLPQQQRVHRPQQVGAQAHPGVGAEQPVQGHDNGAEGERFR